MTRSISDNFFYTPVCADAHGVRFAPADRYEADHSFAYVGRLGSSSDGSPLLREGEPARATAHDLLGRLDDGGEGPNRFCQSMPVRLTRRFPAGKA